VRPRWCPNIAVSAAASASRRRAVVLEHREPDSGVHAHRAQRQVAGGMAVAVVHRLEAAEIQVGHGHAATRAFGRRQRQLRPVGIPRGALLPHHVGFGALALQQRAGLAAQRLVGAEAGDAREALVDPAARRQWRGGRQAGANDRKRG
jgi:hypothetical protein